MILCFNFIATLCVQLHDKYLEFVTRPEKEALAAKLQEVED